MFRSAKSWLLAGGVVLIGWGMIGCGGPSPDEVRARTSSIIGGLAREAGDSLESARKLESLQGALEGLAAIGVPLASATVPSATGSGGASGSSSSSGESSTDLRAEANRFAAQLDELLGRYLFNQASVESSSLGSTTFLLRGELVCAGVATSVSCAGSAAGGEPVCEAQSAASEQESCVETVDRMQLRVVATLVDDDGVDLALRLRQSGTIVLLQLRPQSITLKLELAAARDAALELATLAGTTLDELPDLARGILVLQLTRNGPGDLSAKIGIGEAILVEGRRQGEAYRFSSEARDALASVRLQRAGPSLTLGLDWGATELLAPARLLLGQAPAGRALTFSLAGWSGSLTAAAGQALTLRGLSLGEARLTLDGAPLASASLNAGAPLQAEIEPGQALPRFTLSPRLDLQVALKLGAIESWLEGALPDWARDERYRLLLVDEAQSQPQLQPLLAPQGSSASAIKVLRGQLTLSSEVQPAQVSVAAGQCLLFLEAAEGSQPLLGALASGPCP